MRGPNSMQSELPVLPRSLHVVDIIVARCSTSEGAAIARPTHIDARDVTGSRMKKGAHHGQGSALVVFRRPVQLDRDPLARRDSSITVETIHIIRRMTYV